MLHANYPSLAIVEARIPFKKTVYGGGGYSENEAEVLVIGEVKGKFLGVIFNPKWDGNW
jgi:hypothetical protein